MINMFLFSHLRIHWNQAKVYSVLFKVKSAKRTQIDPYSGIFFGNWQYVPKVRDCRLMDAYSFLVRVSLLPKAEITMHKTQNWTLPNWKVWTHWISTFDHSLVIFMKLSDDLLKRKAIVVVVKLYKTLFFPYNVVLLC